MPRTIAISRRNSTFQVLASLRTNRQKRHRSGTFLVEGVRPITLALRHGWSFAAVLYARGTPLSSWASDVIARAAADRYELAPDLLRELSGKEAASELLALVRMPSDTLERIQAKAPFLAVVMDRPSNPGNLGTLIRSCDAFGASGVVVTGHGVDIYDPATVTASRGSLFALPVVRAESHEHVDAWLHGLRDVLGNLRMAGADESGTVDIESHDLTVPTVLAFGNEARGLSHAYRELCDAHLRIPMAGAATSLNVAVAASIFLYEAGRQRRRGAPG